MSVVMFLDLLSCLLVGKRCCAGGLLFELTAGLCWTELLTCPPCSVVVSRYCPGGPDSDFEYSTQSYTGYEVKPLTWSWQSATIRSVMWQVPTFLDAWAFFLTRKLFAKHLCCVSLSATCVPSHWRNAAMSISCHYFHPLSQVLCHCKPPAVFGR